MKQITITKKQTYIDSSFVLAGGACLLMIAGHFLFPSSVMLFRGFRYLAALATPMLCLWVGRLVRFVCGKVRWWALAPVIILMCLAFYLSRHIDDGFGWEVTRYLWCFLILLGFVLPWDSLYKTRDRRGIKSAVLAAITALTYSVLELVCQRMMTECMKPGFEDMRDLLLVVTTNVIPLAVIPPLFFATEFSLSRPGRWMGSRKWFRWIAGIAAAYCFLMKLPDPVYVFDAGFTGFAVTLFVSFLVQPVTVYLVVIIVRAVRKLCGKKMTWKEVFCPWRLSRIVKHIKEEQRSSYDCRTLDYYFDIDERLYLIVEGGARTHYYYDERGRLCKRVTEERDQVVDEVFEYDPDGDLIHKHIEWKVDDGHGIVMTGAKQDDWFEWNAEKKVWHIESIYIHGDGQKKVESFDSEIVEKPDVWDKSEGVVLETDSEGSWTHLQEFGVKGNLMCDMLRTIEYWEVI